MQGAWLKECPQPGASRQPSPQEKSQEIGIWTMCCGRELPWSGEPQGGGWPGGLDEQTHDSRCNDAYWKSRLEAENVMPGQETLSSHGCGTHVPHKRVGGS